MDNMLLFHLSNMALTGRSNAADLNSLARTIAKNTEHDMQEIKSLLDGITNAYDTVFNKVNKMLLED